MQVNFIFIGNSQSSKEARLIEDHPQIPHIGEEVKLPDDPLQYKVEKVIHQPQNATAAEVHIRAVKSTGRLFI
ncbi:MAG: hypothetical protein NT086_09065 [Proteobacteria bacterium]|nr:hypothetical protein [Pseudomonadota bacterium]